MAATDTATDRFWTSHARALQSSAVVSELLDVLYGLPGRTEEQKVWLRVRLDVAMQERTDAHAALLEAAGENAA